MKFNAFLRDVMFVNALALVYACLAQFVLAYIASNGNVTIFWIPGGLALAVLLGRGLRLWPGVFLGACLAGLLNAYPLWLAMQIAAGNTLETVLATWLLRHQCHFDVNLTTPQDFIRLALVALCTSFISAVMGAMGLIQAGFVPESDSLKTLLLWWQADSLGILLGTPLFLVWRVPPQGWLDSPRIFETCSLFLATLLVGLIVFLDQWHSNFGLLTQSYWLFLFVVWSALRYGRQGVTLVVMLIAILGFEGANLGIGYFAHDMQETGLSNYWFYILILTLVGIFLALNLEARLKAEQQLRQKSSELDNFFKSALDLFCIADFEGYLCKCNPQWEYILGYSPQELQQRKFLDFVHPDDVLATLAAMQQLKLQKPLLNFVNRYRHQDGSFRWLEWRSFPMENVIYACARDITERKKNEDQLMLADFVYQNSSEGMMVVNAENHIISINPAFTQITGYIAADVIGCDPKILNSGKHFPAFFQNMWQQLATEGNWQGEIINRRKSGEEYVEWLVINNVYDSKGEVIRRVGLFADITEKKKSIEKIWLQANYDPLTQLPNRRLFSDRLQHELKKALREKKLLGLLFLDLDHFKEVNDRLGHRIGDALLVEAARRIRVCVRDADTVARLGGDEFTVIVNELSEVTDLDRVAHSILEVLAEPFVFGQEHAYVSASIGIAVYPIDTDNCDDLIRFADQAMYAAKNQGRNDYCFFTSAMQSAVQERSTTANDLHRALEQQEFRIFYQPILNLRSNAIDKAEALLRWQHPQRGLVGPEAFITIAEDNGLMHTIGNWVFKQTLQQLKIWQQQLCADLQMSINNSRVQFQNFGQSANHGLSYLEKIGLPAESIILEIKEEFLQAMGSQVAEKLVAFSQHGVKLALDDFGTGYSSLANLKKFHIDYLKIDASFIQNLAPGNETLLLVETIVEMAHKLGLQVIAEGVETELQRTLLQQCACDYAQGYLIAQALSADAFSAMLAQQASIRLPINS